MYEILLQRVKIDIKGKGRVQVGVNGIWMNYLEYFMKIKFIFVLVIYSDTIKLINIIEILFTIIDFLLHLSKHRESFSFGPPNHGVQ